PAFSSYPSAPHPPLPPFPTRRSSDLSGLAAGDVALAAGGAGPAAESRGIWLGRTPASGNEQSAFETGPGVMGGPAASVCSTPAEDRKSTRLNSSHVSISYAVFCLKKK